MFLDRFNFLLMKWILLILGVLCLTLPVTADLLLPGKLAGYRSQVDGVVLLGDVDDSPSILNCENQIYFSETLLALYGPQFQAFKRRFSKRYLNRDEEQKRLRIFVCNLRIIARLQAETNETAQYTVTQFADLSRKEFIQKFTGFVRKTVRRDRISILPTNLPTSFDWRQKDAVTPVKNQGACGSCWAFSVTGNIEGVWRVKKGQLLSLSEQQLVDCDKIDHACAGGEMLDAYKAVKLMGGLETEDEYPYKARTEDTCRLSKSKIRVYINDSVSLPKNEDSMTQYLVESGPISVAIDASPLMFYRKGIIHPWRLFCSPKRLNHGVLAVGFGEEKGKPFWIIKNSWGEHWGENGYFRLFKGDGVCGVDQDASSVIID